MKSLTLVAVLFLATACGHYHTFDGQQGPPGPAGTVAVVPVAAATSLVQSIVDEENAYREELGQAPLTKGLSCRLATITGGDRIQSSISGHNQLTGVKTVATFLLTKPFNQPNAPITDGLNVLPQALQPVYQNMFLLTCTGTIVIPEDDYYGFQMQSDDAGLMSIDGSLVLNDDNAHGVTTVSGQKFLREGVHTFSLQFAQTGAGSQALILQGSSSTSPLGVIAPDYFFH
jgi:hypothetical protein